MNAYYLNSSKMYAEIIADNWGDWHVILLLFEKEAYMQDLQSYSSTLNGG